MREQNNVIDALRRVASIADRLRYCHAVLPWRPQGKAKAWLWWWPPDWFKLQRALGKLRRADQHFAEWQDEHEPKVRAMTQLERAWMDEKGEWGEKEYAFETKLADIEQTIANAQAAWRVLYENLADAGLTMNEEETEEFKDIQLMHKTIEDLALQMDESTWPQIILE